MAIGTDVSNVLHSFLHRRSKSLDFYGKVMGFFFLSFVMSQVTAVTNVVKASDPDHKIELDLFTYILPFVSIIIDASVKRAFKI